MALYDAFISYSHSNDKLIATVLQSVIQRLGKPWYRRRAIRVFRDDTSLSATPALWPSIERALSQSRYFVLLASPTAAASKWIEKEVAYWLGHNDVERLLIGLTEGQLTWDEAVKDFIWNETTPLPAILSRRFVTEPKWVDLRPYRGGVNPKHARFIELGAEFSATIRNMPKEDLLSQEVRQQKRALTLAWSAAGLLLLLTGISFWLGNNALRNEREAVAQRDHALIAQSRFLADAANRLLANGDAASAMALALEALPDAQLGVSRPYVPTAEVSLYSSQLRLAETAVLAHAVSGGGMSWSSPDGSGQDVGTQEKMVQFALDRLPFGVHMLTLMGGVRAAFSKSGSIIVTWANDGARVWDTTSGRQLAFLRPDELGVTAAAISPDGLRVVTAFPDNTARTWNTTDWSEAVVLRGHSEGLMTASFSPDGLRIVTGSWDKTARVWDTLTGKQVMELRGHDGGVIAAFFDRDGSRIVTVSYDDTIRLWNATTGQELAILAGHTESILDARLSPNGELVATAANDGTARLWNAKSGQQLGYLTLGATNVAFSPDSSRVVVSSRSGTATVVKVQDFSETASLRGHSRGVLSVDYDARGSLIATASNDGSVRLWNSQSGSEVRVFRGHERGIFGTAFNPNGGSVVTMSFDGTARLWRIGSRESVLVHKRTRAGDKSGMSPDENRILEIAEDYSVHVLDTKTKAELVVLKGHKGTVFSAAFSSDGSKIVTASHDATARIWDSSSGREIAILQGHRGGVLSASFSPDGRRIATGSSDKTARLWDIRTNATIAVFTPGYDVFDVAFNLDATRLFTLPQRGDGHAWPLFHDTQQLIAYAKMVIPRCLTQQQRLRFFLPGAPPRWCVSMKKWPYNTREQRQ